MLHVLTAVAVASAGFATGTLVLTGLRQELRRQRMIARINQYGKDS